MSTMKALVTTLVLDGVSWNSFQNLGSQLVNRSRSLLIQSWNVFSEGGQLVEMPGNPNLSKLFSQFDEIVQQNSTSFYDLFVLMQKPPYGANSTVASIIVFLFYAMRSSKYGWKCNNQTIYNESLYVYINQMDKAKNLFILKQKSVDPDLLKQLYLYVRVDNSYVWKDLMDKYTKAKTNRGVLECKRKADSLIAQNIDLPSNYSTQLSALDQASCKAEIAIKKYEDVLGNYNVTKEKVDGTSGSLKLLFVAYDNLYKLNDEMNFLKEQWSSFDIREVQNDMKDAEDLIGSMVTNWNANNPIIPTERNDNYNTKVSNYKYVIKFLHNYKFNSLASTLERYLDESVEQRKIVVSLQQKSNTFVSQVYTLEDDSKMIDGLNYLRVAQDMKTCKNLLQEIQKNLPDCEKCQYNPFDKWEDRIQKVQVLFQDFDDKKRKELDCISSMTLLDDVQIGDLRQRIDGLRIYFFGTEGQAKLESLENELKILEQIHLSFNYATSSKMLENESESAKKKIASIKSPLLDDKAIVDKMIASRQKGFVKISHEWAIQQKNKLNEMHSLKEALWLQATLQNPPVSLVGEDQEEANGMLKMVCAFISEKKVEALIMQFKELSDTEKNEFIKALKDNN